MNFWKDEIPIFFILLWWWGTLLNAWILSEKYQINAGIKKNVKRTQNNKSLTERSFWGCFLWGLAIQIQELYVIFPTEEEDPWSRILVCQHLKDGRDGKDGTGGKETDSILRPFIRIYTGRQRNMKIWKHSANHHHDTTYKYDITRSLGALRAPTSRLRPFGPAW